MNPKYSASRFSAHNSCLQKYKLTYIDELVVENREFSVQKKGLIFHSIAEHTEIGESYESVFKRAEKEIADSGMTKEELEKYPLIKAIPGFYFWWQKYIEENVKNGFGLYKEQWEKGELAGMPLTGALDVCLINEQTTQFRIYDYKTGATAKLSDDYKNQLILYVYMLSKKFGVPENEIPERFKCYLFYPLAGIKDLDVTNAAKVEKLALKNTLEYRFTLEDYYDTIKRFSDVIADDASRDWSAVDQVKDANMDFSCSFCSFCGHPRYCKLTYDAGLTFPRSAKVMTKEESKIYRASQKTK